VHRVKILERRDGGKFRPCNGDFTEDQVAHFELFAKAAAAVAKAVAPPFDAATIVSKVNSSRRKKRSAQKLPSGPGLFDKFDKATPAVGKPETCEEFALRKKRKRRALEKHSNAGPHWTHSVNAF
jgi:hypothetical protein